jgi:hypothetical protein
MEHVMRAPVVCGDREWLQCLNFHIQCRFSIIFNLAWGNKTELLKDIFCIRKIYEFFQMWTSIGVELKLNFYSEIFCIREIKKFW